MDGGKMKQVPFITANSGDVLMVSKKDILCDEIMAFIQDTYPAGGDLPPYWYVEYEHTKDATRFRVLYREKKRPPVLVSTTAVALKNAATVYLATTGSARPNLGDGAAIITVLAAGMASVPMEGIAMLGDLEKIVAIFLLQTLAPSTLE
jgi:hypothetical protein